MNKITLSLLMIIVCAASLFFLNFAGTSVRRAGTAYAPARERFPVYVVHNTSDVCTLWQEKHAYGRVAVHLGRFLHFLRPGTASYAELSQMQLTGTTSYQDIFANDHNHFNNDRADYKSYLWVAFQSNMVREIYNVIPPGDFQKRFGLKDAAAVQKDIFEHASGSPLISTTRLPALAEPVLLNIDASFFASTDPAQFLALLLKSGIKSDIISVCLAEDNPDVSAADRQKLQTFIALLSGHAELLPYVPSSTGPSAGGR